MKQMKKLRQVLQLACIILQSIFATQAHVLYDTSIDINRDIPYFQQQCSVKFGLPVHSSKPLDTPLVPETYDVKAEFDWDDNDDETLKIRGTVSIQVKCPQTEGLKEIRLHSAKHTVTKMTVKPVAGNPSEALTFGDYSIKLHPLHQQLSVGLNSGYFFCRRGRRMILDIEFENKNFTSGTRKFGIVFDKLSSPETNQTVNYVYAQHFSEYLREFFPCFDENRFKAKFRFSVTHPSSHFTLFNTRRTRELYVDSKRQETVFEDYSPLMSPYLFGFAILPKERFYPEHGMVRRGFKSKFGHKYDVDFLAFYDKVEEKDVNFTLTLDHIGQVLKTAEKMLNSPYGVRKFDNLQISDAAGSMENWGLHTYKAPWLMSKGTKVTENQFIEHEIVHNWFGNSVTAKSFDDIWLNEGFTFNLARKVSKSVLEKMQNDNAFSKVLGFYYYKKYKAIMTDSLWEYTNALSSKIKLNAFEKFDSDYYLTVGKGAILVSAVEEILGKEEFMRIQRWYLEIFKNQCVEPKDFLDVVSRMVKDKEKLENIKAFFYSLAYQKGIPVLRMSLSDDKKTLRVSQQMLDRSKLQGEPLENGTRYTTFFQYYFNGNRDHKVFNWLTKTYQEYDLKGHTGPLLIESSLHDYHLTIYDHNIIGDIIKELEKEDGTSLTDQDVSSLLFNEYMLVTLSDDTLNYFFKILFTAADKKEFQNSDILWTTINVIVDDLTKKFDHNDVLNRAEFDGDNVKVDLEALTDNYFNLDMMKSKFLILFSKHQDMFHVHSENLKKFMNAEIHNTTKTLQQSKPFSVEKYVKLIIKYAKYLLIPDEINEIIDNLPHGIVENENVRLFIFAATEDHDLLHRYAMEIKNFVDRDTKDELKRFVKTVQHMNIILKKANINAKEVEQIVQWIHDNNPIPKLPESAHTYFSPDYTELSETMVKVTRTICSLGRSEFITNFVAELFSTHRCYFGLQSLHVKSFCMAVVRSNMQLIKAMQLE